MRQSFDVDSGLTRNPDFSEPLESGVYVKADGEQRGVSNSPLFCLLLSGECSQREGHPAPIEAGCSSHSRGGRMKHT